jgi:hypothetical protein
MVVVTEEMRAEATSLLKLATPFSSSMMSG